MRGFLQITFGPMFSGKSTRLIHNIHKFLDVNEARGTPKKGMIINSSLDERVVKQSCSNLTTHSSFTKEIRKDIICLKVMTLSMISQEMINDVDFIAVDESQFFTDLNIIEDWVNLGKYVHLSGLIADYKRRPFGGMLKLFPLADDIEQLKAFCIFCNSHEMNAPFTKLIEDKEMVEPIYVGGYETFVPVCGRHYHSN